MHQLVHEQRMTDSACVHERNPDKQAPVFPPGSPFLVEMEGSGKPLPIESGMIRVPVNRPAVMSIDPKKAGHLAAATVVEVVSKYMFSDLVLWNNTFFS